MLDEGSVVRRFVEFVGEPFIALLLAVLVAMWTFGLPRGSATSG
jgi:gluconate:H+ symporter, GntP family